MAGNALAELRVESCHVPSVLQQPPCLDQDLLGAVHGFALFLERNEPAGERHHSVRVTQPGCNVIRVIMSKIALDILFNVGEALVRWAVKIGGERLPRRRENGLERQSQNQRRGNN